MKNNIDCPVDLVSVNENRVRLVALLVLLSGILFLWTGWLGIVVFLIVDFSLRSFNLGKFSPLFNLAGIITNLLKLSNKPTDQAPKRFAARMGLAFTSVILICDILQFHITVTSLGLALCFFAFLESFLGICIGCHVYHYSRKLLAQ